MKTTIDMGINNISELQKLLRRADKYAEDLKNTLEEINGFEIEIVNKKPEFNENSDHKKKN
ncbi:hypothetical protein AB283_05905 [Lactobacillus amylovorus]|nr:hypothetical protein AB283_05905 [Lactobacillus amylovorus]